MVETGENGELGRYITWSPKAKAHFLSNGLLKSRELNEQNFEVVVHVKSRGQMRLPEDAAGAQGVETAEAAGARRHLRLLLLSADAASARRLLLLWRRKRGRRRRRIGRRRRHRRHRRPRHPARTRRGGTEKGAAWRVEYVAGRRARRGSN